MTKTEYEAKISSIAGKLQDLEDTIKTALEETKKIIRDMEYLPEVTELEEE